MKKKTKNIRRTWENGKGLRLDLRNRPPDDFDNSGLLLSPEEKYENIRLRLFDQAEVLALLFKIYKENKDLYGDRFLAYVGYEFLKNWPWIDLQFTSAAAYHLMTKSLPPGTQIAGLYDFELPKNVVKTGIVYEHWTPSTFFRDIFEQEPHLTAKDFYELLINYYRVVRITVAEDTRLNSLGFKTVRPVNAYALAGIDIYEMALWDKVYSTNI